MVEIPKFPANRPDMTMNTVSRPSTGMRAILKLIHAPAVNDQTRKDRRPLRVHLTHADSLLDITTQAQSGVMSDTSGVACPCPLFWHSASPVNWLGLACLPAPFHLPGQVGGVRGRLRVGALGRPRLPQFDLTAEAGESVLWRGSDANDINRLTIAAPPPTDRAPTQFVASRSTAPIPNVARALWANVFTALSRASRQNFEVNMRNPFLCGELPHN